MIALLRAILDALGKLLAGQKAASDQVADLKAGLDSLLIDQDIAIEHLRVLIEGDSIPTVVGAPTFTSTGGTP